MLRRWRHTVHLRHKYTNDDGEECAIVNLLVTPSSARKMPFKGLSVLSEKEELVLKKMIIENANSLYEAGIAVTVH